MINPHDPHVSALLTQYKQKDTAIQTIAVCTTDGFPVLCTSNLPDHAFEEDKVAAAASTLFSVSNAVSQQILSSTFQTTFVEAVDGNMAFVSIPCKDKDYVLIMSASSSLNIASLRVFITRLAREIGQAF